MWSLHRTTAIRHLALPSCALKLLFDVLLATLDSGGNGPLGYGCRA
jgi:hypothetical protein